MTTFFENIIIMKLLKIASFLLLIFLFNCDSISDKKKSNNVINVFFSDALDFKNLDGRLLLIFADNNP